MGRGEVREVAGGQGSRSASNPIESCKREALPKKNVLLWTLSKMPSPPPLVFFHTYEKLCVALFILKFTLYCQTLINLGARLCKKYSFYSYVVKIALTSPPMCFWTPLMNFFSSLKFPDLCHHLLILVIVLSPFNVSPFRKVLRHFCLTGVKEFYNSVERVENHSESFKKVLFSLFSKTRGVGGMDGVGGSYGQCPKRRPFFS